MSEISPFSLGELDKLERKIEEHDFDYLVDWSKRAIKHYESEKNRLYELLESLRLRKT